MLQHTVNVFKKRAGKIATSTQDGVDINFASFVRAGQGLLLTA
jgi:hypothetical protein